MKQIIKKTLVSLLNPLIVRLGYNNVHSKNNLSLLERLFSILTKLNFEPKHIVDVGANHGNWTKAALKYFPDAYYTLLEPQNWLKDSIKDLLESNPKIKFHPVGAGSKPGSFKFTIVNRDDSSSFRFTDEEAKKHKFNQITVPVVTLNEFIEQENLPIPDIIKIDAEGLDIEVLKGASNFFGKTEIFMIEAAVGAKDIQNTFLNVINFMNKNEYQLFEITDMNRPFEPKILWLVELVFIKRNGYIDSKKFIPLLPTLE